MGCENLIYIPFFTVVLWHRIAW